MCFQVSVSVMGVSKVMGASVPPLPPRWPQHHITHLSPVVWNDVTVFNPSVFIWLSDPVVVDSSLSVLLQSNWPSPQALPPPPISCQAVGYQKEVHRSHPDPNQDIHFIRVTLWVFVFDVQMCVRISSLLFKRVSVPHVSSSSFIHWKWNDSY